MAKYMFIRNPVVTNAETTADILVLITVALFATFVALNVISCDSHSKLFKKLTYITDIPLVFGILITIEVFRFPCTSLLKLSKPVLIRLASLDLGITIAQDSLMWLMILSFVAGMILIVCGSTKDNAKKNAKATLFKRYPHTTKGIILIIAGILFFVVSNIKIISPAHQGLISGAYNYRTSKVFRHAVNKAKPKTARQVQAKWDIKHYNGKNIKRYI